MMVEQRETFNFFAEPVMAPATKTPRGDVAGAKQLLLPRDRRL